MSYKSIISPMDNALTSIFAKSPPKIASALKILMTSDFLTISSYTPETSNALSGIESSS